MMKYGLLLQTCNSDVLLTRRLLLRIAELDGWRWFSSVFFYIDQDLSLDEFELIIRPCLPAELRVHLFPALAFDEWRQNKRETAVRLYKAVSDLNMDFVKFDADLYFNNLDFLAEFRGKVGFAGRKMPFWAGAKIGREELEFIQGGIVFFGPMARKMLRAISEEDLAGVIDALPRLIKIRSGYTWERCQRYFMHEDILVSGILRQLYGVPIHHIKHLQVSPYDLGIDFKESSFSAAEFFELFSRHTVCAYHYEGANWGNRITMNKYLKWVYNRAVKPAAAETKTIEG
ncbi:MAG: hypothetical protein H6557_28530 [Lewinellaceae bacterium]|nr:hypothetical protein [Phaeodactylibacter sp.]MCB9040592.1 hypothetical protein [Lewinellaceae bacterium]